MTKDEAEALRKKWKQQGLSPPRDRRVCTHPTQEFEWHDDGRLTRNYCCTHCGEIVGKTGVAAHHLHQSLHGQRRIPFTAIIHQHKGAVAFTDRLSSEVHRSG